MGIRDLDVDRDEFQDRILVVTADPKLSATLSELLSERGYVVNTAADFEAAYEIGKATLIDIVIVDVKDLSREDPASALRAFLEDAPCKTCPIVVVRGETIGGIESRRIHQMPSPLKEAELLVKLASLLRVQKLSSTEQEASVTDSGSKNIALRDLINRYQRDLREARDIQQSLLPKSLPRHDRARFAAVYLPLEAVGGDLYDIWKIRDDVFGLLIADVTGHGLPAALIGSMTKMALAHAPKSTAEETLGTINECIARYMPEGKFVTGALAFYDARSGRLELARAGHPGPYLWRRRDGSIDTLTPGGMPLGFLAEARFERLEVELEPGDRLLMVTDGVTETENEESKLIGADGAADWYSKAAREKTLRDCLASLLRQQEAYAGLREPNDDITMLILERSK